MIAKKIPNSKKSSTKSARASGLAEYITQPELTNKIEKCISSEAVNFISTDLKSQTAEMVALSQEVVKSKDPIDHWVLSWKSNERPTPEQAREAAAIFIKQCGLEGHQYITGLHDDTENMHLHIAVNRVHPDTCKVVKINKGFDKEAAQQSIAIIEKVQCWSVETNARYRTNDRAELVIDPATKRPQIFTAAEKQQQPTTKAQAMEVQTGQKSAQRVGIEQAAPIIATATSWKDLHQQMADAGMQYQRKGSGAVVQVGADLVKASDIDRKASLSALEKRFGPYQPPQEIKPNEYHHHAKKPNPIALGKEAGNGMRKLSECNLAVLTNQGQTRRPGVLHIDARPGGRPVDGLRRDARPGRTPNTELTRQPLKDKQPGWNEYIAIRDTQKAAKTHETIDLQKRHGDERAALAATQKAERDKLFSGDWRGKGDLKNALKSITATQQAADKLELSAKHREERKALQAEYKPLPIYKVWKEQPQIVSLTVRPLIDQHIERDKQITVAQTLRSLTNNIDARQHITYQLDRKDVFRDEGRTIAILDLNSERGIAAALATAQQKFGNVLELTGSDAFKKNAVAVAVANGLTCKFSDPALDKLRENLQQQKYEAAREAAQAERERIAAAQLEKVKALTPAIPPIQQTREAVPPVVPSAQHQPEPETEQPVEELDEEVQKTEHQPEEIDYLDDIYRQIEAAKATASQYSPLHSPAVLATDADHAKHIESPILASNDQFIVVNIDRKPQILKLEILNQNVEYEGHAQGANRYAVGNEVSIAPQQDGSTKTVISEEREAMQTEARKVADRSYGMGN